jgi:hypothetical protein
MVPLGRKTIKDAIMFCKTLKKVCVLLLLTHSYCVFGSNSPSVEQAEYKNGQCTRPLAYTQSSTRSCLDAWIERTFSKFNCQIDFLSFIPRDRRMMMLEQGRIDLEFALSKTPEREQTLLFSKGIFREEFGLYGHAATLDMPVKQLCDQAMRRHDIVFPKGYYISDEVSAALENRACYHSIQHPPISPGQAINMVNTKRADVTILPVSYYQSNNPKIDFKKTKPLYRHPVSIYGESEHLAFSKQSVSPTILKPLNKALDERTLDDLKRCMNRPN